MPHLITIISFLLLLLIIIYIYQDFLLPYLSSFTKQFESFTANTNSISNDNILSNILGDNFGSISDKWYINNHNKPIILNNNIELPIIRYGYYANDSYDNMVGNYFRHHIYPIKQTHITTGLETIYQLINGDLDLAFIDEELLVRFIKHDCKYLTKYITDNLNLPDDTNNTNDPDKIYPEINFSAVGVGYYCDFLLIVNNYSNIMQFEDIQTHGKLIGVLEDSYYLFIKLIAAYDMDISKLNIVRIIELEELIENFQINRFDALFIITHPKNKQLVELTNNTKCRYIHIQKRKGLDSRNNLQSLSNKFKGTDNPNVPALPNLNRQMIYSKSLMQNLQTENITTTFNDIITKYYQKVTPKIVNLNQFHKSGNAYTYLETYTTRMILVINNNISKKQIKYLTKNYINELTRLKNQIDREQFNPQLDNFSSNEFEYNELVSFDKVIPISEGSKEIYIEEGLITYSSESHCVL